ncbi:MAG: sugar transferase [Vampirovibrionales bacterium]
MSVTEIDSIVTIQDVTVQSDKPTYITDPVFYETQREAMFNREREHVKQSYVTKPQTPTEELDPASLYLGDYSLKSPFVVSHLLSSCDHKIIQFALKRVMDVGLTLLGLTVAIWPLLVVAIIIRMTSKGSIFFKQTRVGLHGKRFKMYKFRSMYQDAESRLDELMKHNTGNEVMFKMENDPRITPIGKFIRKYSINEFPQLINVLKGEMSLVGPRPPIERELYASWHYLRFSTLPGMTGAWQTMGRASINSFDDVVKLDVDYIKTWSIWRDLTILMNTPKAVLLARGAS